MAALISSRGKTFDIMLNENITLFAPEFIIQEINKYNKEILFKSNLKENELKLFFDILLSHIVIVKQERCYVNQAKIISPDVNDVEYFALAIQLNIPIWSNDKKLKTQNKIKIYSTEEIIKIIEHK